MKYDFKNRVMAIILCICMFVSSGNVVFAKDNNYAKTDSETAEYMPGNVIVCFDKSATEEEINSVLSSTIGFRIHGEYNGKRLKEPDMEMIRNNSNDFIVRLDYDEDSDLDSIIEQLLEMPCVEWAHKNFLAQKANVDTPLNDWYADEEWYFESCGFDSAFSIVERQTHSTVKIAVIDGGMDTSLSEVSDIIIDEESVDVTTLDQNGDPMRISQIYPQYDDDHGAMCTGIIGARVNNNFGLAGAARGWNNDLCEIMEIKVARYNPNTQSFALDLDDIAYGVEYAVDHGADVISLSMTMDDVEEVRSFADYAYNHGVVLIASAGNENSLLPRYPAAYDNVIGVGGTTEGNVKSSFSSYGSVVDITAPSTGFVSLCNSGEYYFYHDISGTSFATPLVASAAALMLSVKPTLTPLEVKGLLQDSATYYQDSGYSDYFSYGCLNARKAIEEVVDFDRIVNHTHTFITRGFSFTCPSCNYTCSQYYCPVCWETLIGNRIFYSGRYADFGCPNCGWFSLY